jgi:hypothetical protein
MATHEETLSDLISRQRAAKSELARLIAEGGRTSDDDEPTVMQLSRREAALIEAVRAVGRERR